MPKTPAKPPLTALAPIAAGPPSISRRANRAGAGIRRRVSRRSRPSSGSPHGGGEHRLEGVVGRRRDDHAIAPLPAGRAQHDQGFLGRRIAARGEPVVEVRGREDAVRQLEARRQAARLQPGFDRRYGLIDVAIGRAQRPAGVDAHRIARRRIEPPAAQDSPLPRGPGVVGQRLQPRRINHFSARSFSTIPRTSSADQSAGPARRARSRP